MSGVTMAPALPRSSNGGTVQAARLVVAPISQSTRLRNRLIPGSAWRNNVKSTRSGLSSFGDKAPVRLRSGSAA